MTTDAVAAASQSVVQTLAAAGLDTTAVGDPLTGTLAAGSGSAATTAWTRSAARWPAAARDADHADRHRGGELAGLDQRHFDHRLEQRSRRQPAARGTAAQAQGGERCDALPGSSHRFLIAKPSASTNRATGHHHRQCHDGRRRRRRPTWDFGDGTVTLTSVAGENCHYTVAGTDGLTGEFVISPSGYAVGRLSNTWTDGESAPDAARRMAIAIPTRP